MTHVWTSGFVLPFPRGNNCSNWAVLQKITKKNDLVAREASTMGSCQPSSEVNHVSTWPEHTGSGRPQERCCSKGRLPSLTASHALATGQAAFVCALFNLNHH